MRAITVAGVFAMLVVAGASAPSRPATSLKCSSGKPTRFPNAPEPVYVLDGRAVALEAVQPLDRDTIHSIEVLCFDEVYRRFGIEARRSGVVVFTVPGPHAALRATLDTLVARQREFAARHGRFARSLTELAWSPSSTVISIDLIVTEDGSRWSAAGTHRHLRASEATMSVGGESTQYLEHNRQPAPPAGG